MRSIKTQWQLSLNKVLLLAVFLVVVPLRFFPFCCLFFWRSVFLLRVFSQVTPLPWLAYFESIQFVAFFVCTLSYALAFSLCFPSALPFSLFRFLFSLFPITRTRRTRRVCPVYLYWTFPELQLSKKKPQVCGWRWGRAEGGGWRKRKRGRGCVYRPFNVIKQTRTHRHTLGNIWHRQGSRSLALIYLFLSPSASLSLTISPSLSLSLTASGFVSLKFRNKEKIAVAIFCILKCDLYVYIH